jgi:hypothetical protein
MTIPAVGLVAPASKTWLGVGREGTMGQAVLPVQTIPLLKNSYQPEDVPKWLHDEAIRGSMALVFNDIQGVESSTFSYGGPAFLDVEGYFIDNVFGDLSSTAQNYTGTTTTGTIPLAIGATALGVAGTAGFPTGFYAAIDQPFTGLTEIVGPITTTAGTISFTGTPTRFAHANGGTVSAINPASGGPYTHTWNILNNSSGQPPTHTFTDYTSLTTTVGARSYVGAAVGVLDITGNSEQLLEMKMTGDAWVSAPASIAPTNTVSTAIPIPNWRSTVTVAGGQVFDVGEWSVSIKRTLQIYWTDQGNTQNPYIIARGPLDATGTLNYTVPTDESPLTQMLSNTQPTLLMSVNNGLGTASTSYLSLTIACHTCAFEKAKPDRGAVLVGYQDEWQAVANSTNSGGSGGLGPITVTLINNIPTY